MIEGTHTLKVAVVEDEALYRDLLRVALSHHAGFEVVGVFADAASAAEAIPGLAPDVVVLDVEPRSGLNGIQLGLRLRRALPDLSVVVFSHQADPDFLSSLPPEQADGWSYLLKSSVNDSATLARAIEGAAAHFMVLDPHLFRARPPPSSAAWRSSPPASARSWPSSRRASPTGSSPSAWCSPRSP